MALNTERTAVEGELRARHGGTGFWHELYFMRGGMEVVYLDIADHPLGFLNFAPAGSARGAMFSARNRLKAGG